MYLSACMTRENELAFVSETGIDVWARDYEEEDTLGWYFQSFYFALKNILSYFWTNKNYTIQRLRLRLHPLYVYTEKT